MRGTRVSKRNPPSGREGIQDENKVCTTTGARGRWEMNGETMVEAEFDAEAGGDQGRSDVGVGRLQVGSDARGQEARFI